MAKKKVVKEEVSIFDSTEKLEIIIDGNVGLYKEPTEKLEVAAWEEVNLIDTKAEELLDIQNQLNSKPNSDQRTILLARQTVLQKK